MPWIRLLRSAVMSASCEGNLFLWACSVICSWSTRGRRQGGSTQYWGDILTWRARRNVTQIHRIYFTYPSGKVSRDNVRVWIVTWKMVGWIFCLFPLLPVEWVGDSSLPIGAETRDTAHTATVIRQWKHNSYLFIVTFSNERYAFVFF